MKRVYTYEEYKEKIRLSGALVGEFIKEWSGQRISVNEHGRDSLARWACFEIAYRNFQKHLSMWPPRVAASYDQLKKTSDLLDKCVEVIKGDESYWKGFWDGLHEINPRKIAFYDQDTMKNVLIDLDEVETIYAPKFY